LAKGRVNRKCPALKTLPNQSILPHRWSAEKIVATPNLFDYIPRSVCPVKNPVK
jgi:hypothetical protein